MRQVGRWLMRGFLAAQVHIYRLSSGRIGGKVSGLPVLLLTTIGRKTGNPRTTVVMYQTDGDRLVVTATNNGADRHPGWYHNLRSNPNVEVEVGSELSKVHARVTEGEERAIRYQRFVDALNRFRTYQERTSRTIPVVVLEPHQSAT